MAVAEVMALPRIGRVRKGYAPTRMQRRTRRRQARLYRVTAGLVGLAALCFLLQQFAPRASRLVESLYSRGLYRLISMAGSFVTGAVPYSVAELALMASPILLFTCLYRFFRRASRSGIPWPTACGRLVCGVAACGAAAYSFFVLAWGLNYSRLPLADIAGYDVRPTSASELADLCMQLSTQANALRRELPSDGQGMVAARRGNVALMHRVNDAYQRAGVDMPWLSGPYAAPKPVILSTSMCWTGVTGIYMPFTFEANVNVRETPMLLAATAAHEEAHLRGFAREDEANAIAYFVCRASQDADIRYAGTMLALVHAQNALYGEDRALYGLVAALQSEDVRRDQDQNAAFWRQFDGPVREAQTEMNDAYLRGNHQAEGVKSYGRMIDLLLAERRAQSGG